MGSGVRWCVAVSLGVVLLASTADAASATGATATGSAWSEPTVPGPPTPARADFAHVYDPIHDVLTIFGGFGTCGGHLSDVWTLTGAASTTSATWVNRTPATGNPAGRWASRAVYDAVSNRMTIFGGNLGCSSPATNEVLLLANANGVGASPAWIPVAPAGPAPGPRSYPSAVYDPVSNSMIVQGGNNAFSGASYGDTWALRNANGLDSLGNPATPTWVQIPTSPASQFRDAATAVYNALANTMIVFGGRVCSDPPTSGNCGSGFLTSKAWALSNANGLGPGTPTWTELTPTGTPPPARASQVATYDVANDRMIVFGGGSSTGVSLSDTWVLSGGTGPTPAWQQLTPDSPLPPGRCCGGGGYNPALNRLLIFGGVSTTGVSLSDTWVLSDANGITPLPVKTSLSGGGQSGANITVTAGTPVHDSATLTGAQSATASGTVTYNVYSDNKCTVLVASGGTKAVSSGVVPDSDPVTLTTTGTFFWLASYSGDANNSPSNSGCGAETETVGKASPTLTTQATPSATAGGTISDTATLLGGAAPTGTITFNVFGPNNATCTGSPVFTSTKVVTGNGTYLSDPDIATAAGTYYWVASYSGDATNSSATTKCGDTNEISTVNKATTAITTQATASATVGGTISDTAALSGGVKPTGTITFNVFGPNDATCTVLAAPPSVKAVTGNGSYTSDPVTPTAAGTYRWVASYSGDPNNSPAATACNDKGETSAVFSFAPGGGSFVIGDQNAMIGNSVTFWGAKWAKLNSLSGGDAPSSFKGFAENPTTPSCGAGWSADPGNSTPPPDGPLPAFMAVIVTSSADKSGSTISGNTVHIVIVQTNPGYAPNPGHAGTGTVVAAVC